MVMQGRTRWREYGKFTTLDRQAFLLNLFPLDRAVIMLGLQHEGLILVGADLGNLVSGALSGKCLCGIMCGL